MYTADFVKRLVTEPMHCTRHASFQFAKTLMKASSVLLTRTAELRKYDDKERPKVSKLSMDLLSSII